MAGYSRERILESCQNLLDFIGSSPGGDSWLETPDGKMLRTDWGYVMDGLICLKEWAKQADASRSKKKSGARPYIYTPSGRVEL